MGKRLWAYLSFVLCTGVVFAEDDAVAPPPMEIVISVADQKLALVKEGGLLKKYPISTSKFGLGDSYGSYKTPLGHLRICDKIGGELSLGAVIKHRNATGEVLPVNAPGRDPIVTRIMWLEGLESCNSNARARGVYIHGTVEESKLGQPVSYGCIRMKSTDVIEVFDETPMGTSVNIMADHLPKLPKWTPRPQIVVASNTNAASTPNGAAAGDSIVTQVGPHGLVIVKTTNRMGQVAVVDKPKPAPAAVEPKATPAPMVAETKPAPKPQQQLVAEKAPAPPVAKAPASNATPALNAPTVVFASAKIVPKPPLPAQPPAPVDSPRVEFAMRGSILDSGLPAAPKLAPPPRFKTVQPAQPEEKPAPAPVAQQTTESSESSAPTEPHTLVLQSPSPDVFLGVLDTTLRSLPLDALTTDLLEAPLPAMHLAFRTWTAPVGSPDL